MKLRVGDEELTVYPTFDKSLKPDEVWLGMDSLKKTVVGRDTRTHQFKLWSQERFSEADGAEWLADNAPFSMSSKVHVVDMATNVNGFPYIPVFTPAGHFNLLVSLGRFSTCITKMSPIPKRQSPRYVFSEVGAAEPRWIEFWSVWDEKNLQASGLDGQISIDYLWCPNIIVDFPKGKIFYNELNPLAEFALYLTEQSGVLFDASTGALRIDANFNPKDARFRKYAKWRLIKSDNFDVGRAVCAWCSPKVEEMAGILHEFRTVLDRARPTSFTLRSDDGIEKTIDVDGLEER